MQGLSLSIKQLKRRGLALLPGRCPRPLHGPSHQGRLATGYSTGRDTLGGGGLCHEAWWAERPCQVGSGLSSRPKRQQVGLGQA